MCPQTGTPSAKVIVQGHRPWRGRAMSEEPRVNGKRLSLPGTQSHLHHNHSPGLPEGPRPSMFSAWGRPKYSVHLTNTDRAPTVCWAHSHSGINSVLSPWTLPPRRVQSTESPPPLSVPSLPVPMVGPHVRRPCQRSPDRQPQVIGPWLPIRMTTHPSSHFTEGAGGIHCTQSGQLRGQPPEASCHHSRQGPLTCEAAVGLLLLVPS